MPEQLYTISELCGEVNRLLKGKRYLRTITRDEVTSRTARYYVQQELLPPPAGKRGPRTRYTSDHVYRIVCILLLQEEVALTLEEIRRVLNSVPAETIAAVATGKKPLDVLDLRTGGYQRGKVESEAASWRARGEAAMAGDRPKQTHMAGPRARARLLQQRQTDAGESNRINLTDEVELTVRRKLSQRQREQLQLLGQLIQSILQSEDEE